MLSKMVGRHVFVIVKVKLRKTFDLFGLNSVSYVGVRLRTLIKSLKSLKSIRFFYGEKRPLAKKCRGP